MFVQTEITPNPNSLKFLPGKSVSNKGSFEITQKDQTNNELVKNLLSINGVEGIFLGKDFISINKYDDVSWEEIKHIVISLINDYYANGNEFVINKQLNEEDKKLGEIEKKIVQILDQKIRPAIAKDGGIISILLFKVGISLFETPYCLYFFESHSLSDFELLFLFRIAKSFFLSKRIFLFSSNIKGKTI